MENIINDFRDRKIVFVDLEMTGLYPFVNEIVEIRALIVNGRNFEIEKEFHAKVRPLHPETATKDGLEISGYNTLDWKDSPHPKEILEKFAHLVPGAMIAGWNIWVDWTFLQIEFHNYQIKHDYDYRLLDIASIAYVKLFNEPNVSDIRMRTISKYLGLKVTVKHDALTDIKATFNVFQKLLEK